ncbi:MAG: SRPBCC family protein [Flavobacteriales bacterium]
MKVCTIRQTATFAATPNEVYTALMDARLHSRFTGSEAHIGKGVGDAFTSYDGYIDGLNLALEPGKRIVQSWRAQEKGWPEDHYSQVSYKLVRKGKRTRLVFQHERVPSELAESLRQGWKEHYWHPLRAMLQQN